LLLIELWTKAVKAQSGSWKVVGSMAETETSDVSHLTVSAGSGVKFVISSPKKAPLHTFFRRMTWLALRKLSTK
jgi:hypothetical protein